MPLNCTRCQGTGFLNIEQVPDELMRSFDENGDHDPIKAWIEEHDNHDVSVCDCCGNGEYWYGVPGEHYNADDLPGNSGPYAYNGGLCECH
jgi:hypothetical protein